MQFILEAKAILKKTVHKTMQYFSQYTNILRVIGVVRGDFIYFWKYKRLSDENITAPTTSDYSLNPQLSYFGTKTRVEFKGSCLKQNKITYTHGKIVNIYTYYEISNNNNNNNSNSNYLTLKNCLFGAVILTKNSDIDKYIYFGYGTGFDGHGSYSHPNGGNGRNVIILWEDVSSSKKIDNRKKDILILGLGPTQGLEHALSVEKMYSI